MKTFFFSFCHDGKRSCKVPLCHLDMFDRIRFYLPRNQFILYFKKTKCFFFHFIFRDGEISLLQISVQVHTPLRVLFILGQGERIHC